MKIHDLIQLETERQNNGIELIASENYPSKKVREACGSILTCKYAEGYPGKRYYGGCQYIDEIEKYAQEKIGELFGCKYVNVQPHCGSAANYAAYHALMPNGGKILTLDLNSGGHLTHGSPVSFSSHDYKIVNYHLYEDGTIDMHDVLTQAALELPDVILCGFSAYPYTIDFAAFRKIADEITKVKGTPCYLMADIAHIAGLIAAGEHPSPFPYCDVVTSTTHKTLRGPRGGIIMTNDENLFKKINSAVFPYIQGGPLEHIIAAKALMAEEDLKPEFKEYIKRVKENTFAAAKRFEILQCKVSKTENHLFLLNTLDSFGLTGIEAQKKLEEINITTNKNMIPGDTLTPNKTSGLRIGFAAVTSRGLDENGTIEVVTIMFQYLKGLISTEQAKERVKEITEKLLKIEELDY